MIPAIRQAYNQSFTKEQYETFLANLNAVHPGGIEFRVAETPIFVPKDFKDKILDACEAIVDIIADPGFKNLTRNAIPKGLAVPGENEHTHFIAFDFGICINEAGEYEPQLIEMQGFPTLFAYEVLIDEVFRQTPGGGCGPGPGRWPTADLPRRPPGHRGLSGDRGRPSRRPAIRRAGTTRPVGALPVAGTDLGTAVAAATGPAPGRARGLGRERAPSHQKCSLPKPQEVALGGKVEVWDNPAPTPRRAAPR